MEKNFFTGQTKTLNNFKEADRNIRYLINNKFSFTLKLSNFTTQIICEEAPFFNKTYLQQARGIKVFIAYKKILKDLREFTANEPPIIEKGDIDFYSFNKDIKPVKPAYCRNIDLKSAYATILFNDGFISENTYEYIQKLPKIDRLACIGMMASRKEIFTYTDGINTGYTEEINEMQDYFYHCVKRTQSIMANLAEKLERDFIFSWVDSVYYYDDSAGVNDFLCTQYLNRENFKYHLKDCIYLNIQKKKELINISFFDEKQNFKEFNIPTINNNFKRLILQTLNLI